MPRDEVLVADILFYARQAARGPLIVLGEAAAHVSDAYR